MGFFKELDIEIQEFGLIHQMGLAQSELNDPHLELANFAQEQLQAEDDAAWWVSQDSDAAWIEQCNQEAIRQGITI